MGYRFVELAGDDAELGWHPADELVRGKRPVGRAVDLLDERNPGGLGIHLMRSMMDRLDYRHGDRQG